MPGLFNFWIRMAISWNEVRLVKGSCQRGEQVMTAGQGDQGDEVLISQFSQTQEYYHLELECNFKLNVLVVLDSVSGIPYTLPWWLTCPILFLT